MYFITTDTMVRIHSLLLVQIQRGDGISVQYRTALVKYRYRLYFTVALHWKAHEARKRVVYEG